jgi:hypothetical protein
MDEMKVRVAQRTWDKEIILNCTIGFIGSFTMVILVLEPTSTGIDWPEDVECETGRIQHYFTTPGSVKQILHMES